MLGGAAVFLLGTKKGNKVLKTLTEDGFEGLTSLIEEIEKTNNGELPKPKTSAKKITPKLEEVEEEMQDEEIELTNGNGVSHEQPRRFFKRK